MPLSEPVLSNHGLGFRVYGLGLRFPERFVCLGLSYRRRSHLLWGMLIELYPMCDTRQLAAWHRFRV